MQQTTKFDLVLLFIIIIIMTHPVTEMSQKMAPFDILALVIIPIMRPLATHPSPKGQWSLRNSQL